MKTNKLKKLRRKLFPYYFDKLGIELPYRMGSVLWIWPWLRQPVKWYGLTVGSGVWLSFDFNGYFPTLQSIDDTWTDCFNSTILSDTMSMAEVFDEPLDQISASYNQMTIFIPALIIIVLLIMWDLANQMHTLIIILVTAVVTAGGTVAIIRWLLNDYNPWSL